MKIVDSDAFLDMPLSSQCLYFHLNMRADDDGFIGNPKKIILPPKPAREEIETPTDLKGIAGLLNYYEHLVQQWEEWADSVEAILTETNK